MKILKGKSRRTQILAVITFAMIIILFGLNLLLSLVGLKNSVYVDMTPEGLYSVTDRMVEECAFIDTLDSETTGKKLKIIFCNDPDNLMDSAVTRVTYFMALKLDKIFDNLEVETVNVNFNPTAVSKYKATSLSEIKTTDVIVAYGDRYRIAGAQSFWTTGSSGTFWSYNGEYKLATLIKSVTLANDSNPAAYFITGHGETYYDAANPDSVGSVASEQLKNLILDRGLQVKLLSLSEVDEIPNDCALLILNNPTKDFTVDKDRLDEFGYVTETEKIDRYLTKKQGALMVAKDPELSLPVLEDFLKEWGFLLPSTTLKVPKDESKLNTPEDSSENRTDKISAVYTTDEESYAYAIYSEFSSLSSAPKTVFMGAGYIECAFGEDTAFVEPGAQDVSKVYSSFLTTPSTAVPYKHGSDSVVAGEMAAYDIAAVTTRTDFDSITAEYTYSYVFCANDGDFFSNDLLGNAAYANFDIMSALITNMSRMDIYASSDLGGTSLNTEKFGGKQLVSTTLSAEDTEIYSSDATEIIGINYGVSTTAKVLITVFVAAIPVTVLVLGIVIHIKRKYM